MDDMDNLSGVEFENLCQVLISKMGFDVTPTKTTGDGGIDLIAYNEQPIIQGKYIIQCKRYSGSVGEPILRDLYGVVMSERANKGILITTGDFTSSAVHFAEGKTLELIDGKKLKALLNQYGIVISNASITNYSSTVRDALRISIHDNAQEEYDYLLQEKDKSSDNIIAYLRLLGFAEEAIFTYSVVDSFFNDSEKINNIKRCVAESEKYIDHVEKYPIQNKQTEFIHYSCLCVKMFHYLKLGELDKSLKLSLKILKWDGLSKSNVYYNGLGYLLALIINNDIQIYRLLGLYEKAESLYTEYSGFIVDYMYNLDQNYNLVDNIYQQKMLKSEFDILNINSLPSNNIGYFITFELNPVNIEHFINSSKWDTQKKCYPNRIVLTFSSINEIMGNNSKTFPFCNYNDATKMDIKMNANLLT